MLSGFVEVAVQRVFGDVEDLADLRSGLGDQEGAAVVEEADGADLVRLVHEGSRFAGDPDTFLNQRVEQIRDIRGDLLGLGFPVSAGIEGMERILRGKGEGQVGIETEDPDDTAVVITDEEAG